jgi:predicted metal-dependent phosphoesterase TrpH
MLVELHTHTTYSKRIKVPVEGLNTPDQMVRHAKKLGLGAIAITDHDEIRGALQYKALSKKHGMIVIPGEEVTTASGHMLALGINEYIQPGMSVEETVDEIHSQGGLAIGDHPFDINNDGIKHLASKTDAIEIFNAISVDRISNRKAKRFADLWKKPQVAGSDAHCIEMLGHGINEIDADSIDGILNAVRKGNVQIRRKYIPSNILMHWSVTRLKLSYPFIMTYINENYSLPKRWLGRNALGLVNRSPGNVDYFFKGIAYFSLGSVIVYSALRELSQL